MTVDKAIEKLKKLREEAGEDVPLLVVQEGYPCPSPAEDIIYEVPMFEDRVQSGEMEMFKCFNKWDKVVVIV
jgi:hypothetical protein